MGTETPAPFAPMVGVAALCAALDTSPATLHRKIKAGEIPDGERADTRAGPKTGGRKWSPEAATKIVRAARRPVPPGWDQKTRGGSES